MVKILEIVKEPNKILHKKSAEVEKHRISSKDFQELCFDMAETMMQKNCIGLAAPQIGKSIRLIVISTKDGQVCMINPKITKKSFAKEWGEEGCASFPNLFGKVKRHKKITCSYLNIKGERITEKAEGLLARVIQHEVDHLDGILFIEKAKDLVEMKNG